MGILSRQEIDQMGFSHVGENAHLSDRASYYGCSKIIIEDHVRIDDYCVLSAGHGGIHISSYVHIAVYVSLIGAGKISVGSFSSVSSRVAIYSSNDDYSGAFMTGPIVPSKFTNIHHADVTLGPHVVIGSGSVVLPGIDIEAGAVVGALSLVKESCYTLGVYAGVPARKIATRKNNLLELEHFFWEDFNTKKERNCNIKAEVE